MDIVSPVPRVLLSIVSHGHARLVERLLDDIDHYCRAINLSVVLTENIDEPFNVHPQHFSFPLVRIHNLRPRGFGANHNHAFATTDSDYICIVNPDISFQGDPISPLLVAMQEASVVAAAPLTHAPDGKPQDSVRKKITPARLLTRVVVPARRTADYPVDGIDGMVDIDWAAGMFLLVRSEAFRQVGGFDERYFMYCEDADLCARLHRRGGRICLVPEARVIHDARRASHGSGRHLRWHILSLLRFLFLHYLSLRVRG